MEDVMPLKSLTHITAAVALFALPTFPVTSALAYDPVMVPAGEGEMLEVLGAPLEVLVRKAQTDGDFSVVISQDFPGGGPGPNVIHADRSETFFVIEGDYTFFSDGKEITGGPGTIVVNPKGVRHGFINSGTTQGKLLMMYSPGGFEDFFTEVGQKKLQPGPELGALEASYGTSRLPPE
jgi:mannose-6-phosphate isomerase-like protein (cupin superfamily)